MLPPNVEDFDSECGNDPFQTPQYAQDIFLYFKEREVFYSFYILIGALHQLFILLVVQVHPKTVHGTPDRVDM